VLFRQNSPLRWELGSGIDGKLGRFHPPVCSALLVILLGVELYRFLFVCYGRGFVFEVRISRTYAQVRRRDISRLFFGTSVRALFFSYLGFGSLSRSLFLLLLVWAFLEGRKTNAYLLG